MLRSSLISLLFFISACATISTDPIIAPTTTIQKKQIVVDPEAMKDCEDLKTLTYPSSFEDIVIMYANNLQIYVRCKSQNNSKKEVINKLIIGDNK